MTTTITVNTHDFQVQPTIHDAVGMADESAPGGYAFTGAVKSTEAPIIEANSTATFHLTQTRQMTFVELPLAPKAADCTSR
jgi:hypothetical protein